MRLLPRSSTEAANIFSSLSLAIANYKPTPILPSSAVANVTSSNGYSAGGSSFASTAHRTAPNSFQAATSPSAPRLPGQDHDATWGQPSILYLPEANTDSAPPRALTAQPNQLGPAPMGSSSSFPVAAASLQQMTAGMAGTSVASGQSSRVLADTKKIGPGNCPVIMEEYVPVGGWDAVPPPVYPPFDPVKSNIMRYRQQIGVNLGSWFAQENWMDPGFFACATGGAAAEYDILDGYGQSPNGIKNVTQKMTKHWDTWIVEDDFRRMASIGINTVRLPVGYWSAGPYYTHDSPFSAYADVYQYSWRFVARAINWAAKYDIGVILDLHGAYGSQNGQAHSGLSDGNIEFFTPFNMNLTAELLKWFAHEVSDVTNIVGIQLLNEPQNRDSLWPWYNATMDAMRRVSTAASTVPLYFHDAFNLNRGADFVSGRSDFVVQDHHSYYVYTASDTSQSAQGHVSDIHGTVADQLNKQSTKARRNLIIGEWSCALAPSSLEQSDDPVRDQTAFCGAQNTVYSNATAGWTFWSWKLSNCDSNAGWCFQGTIDQFLKVPFNTWGLPDAVSSSLSSMTSDQQKTFARTVETSIKAIQLPDLPSVLQQQTPGLMGSSMAASQPLAGAHTLAKDTPRIGKVVSSSSSGGSLAARAASLVRASELQSDNLSTSTRALLSQNTGYSDGFLSAKIFAAGTSLSRIGFGPQYIQDSWTARAGQGRLQASDRAAYEQSFLAGLQDAEGAIVRVLQNALTSSAGLA